MDSPSSAIIYWCMILSVSYLTSSVYTTSIAHDHPIHTLSLYLFGVGLLLTVFCGSCARLFKVRDSRTRDLDVALQELPRSTFNGDGLITEHMRHDTKRLWYRKDGYLLVSMIIAMTLRIELLREMLKAPQCTINGFEVFVPLTLSFYDSYRFWASSSHNRSDHPFNDTIYDAIYRSYLGLKSRYVFQALLVSIGGHLALGIWYYPPSTYICPLVGPQIRMIPVFQLLSAVLDCYLALAIQEVFLRNDGHSETTGQNPSLALGSTFLASSAFWFMTGFIVFLAKPEYRNWLLPIHLLSDFGRCFSLLGYFILFALACICSLYCICHLGILDVAMTLTTICISIPSLTFLWKHRQPYPPFSLVSSLWSFILLLGGYLWFHHTRQISLKPIKSLTYFLIFLALISALYPALSRPVSSKFHPIDLLISEAKSKHDYYTSYSTQSYNIEEAAAQYKRRYRMTPPPGFDVWYQYALARKSVIIDQYDQIYQDTIPFWAIPPEKIRRATWELISNPWNDIGGISIREGSASISANVPGTHRWMLDGLVLMINSFAQHLPDMDLAFNLNDEARVAVPFDTIQALRSTAMDIEDRLGRQSWSSNRVSGWKVTSKDPFTSSIFQDKTLQNIFLEFGSVGCKSSSSSRRERMLWPTSYVCLSCAAPHSIGHFLSNWSMAADVCHQPDLAHLHGFYMSPAAFKGTNKLVPVFSQSKPHGFNDIIYPSAWNYMDKVLYAPTDSKGDPDTETYDPGHPDPEFSAKENILFWRGATSEGLASGKSAWQGMARQRLVHLVNNATSSAHDTTTILLLRTDSEKPVYRYIDVPGDKVKSLGLNTDIAIVDRIARCGERDCGEQEAEFALVKPVDFQSHWRYRYLFDLDGAGFSGRFLPFLHSNSVPVKTGLFREWYDERITAWHHFIPVDVRLHGVWSTLAYFAGLKGILPTGQKVELEAHLKEGEKIAQQGKEWAGKVLRKEDMEIYLFRVLLEWGRLTDDNREKIGFVPTRKSS